MGTQKKVPQDFFKSFKRGSSSQKAKARLSHYYWFSIMAKTEDAIRSIASSFLGMISIFEVVDGSNLIGLWLPPHHFFLQNLIWREATIVWNGHQSKKLKNRFRLRCSKGPIVYWILWGRIKWNWLNEKSLLEFVPSFLQFRILQWGWKDKQMQISLVFC